MDQPVAIFGSGRSGQAARRLARARGYEAKVFDEGGEGDFDTFDASQLDRFSRFVFSPGFAASHPWRRLLAGTGKTVQSELGFAAGFWRGRILGVTGTNGKTTLTRFMAEALQCAGRHAVVAGNIGQPLSDVVLDFDNSDDAIAVCEISSFQAELTEGLELDALLWINFAEDHLDRYEGMTDYFLAKSGLFKCLKKEAFCVVGPQVVPWLELDEVAGERAVIAHDDNDWKKRLQPDSVFNRAPFDETFSLAAEYWWLSGEDEGALIAAADAFSLSPHRLDVVREKQGVTYWNDSKSTNFHSTLAALKAVPGPIVWIGGGRTKGGDMEAFARAVSREIDHAVLYGEAAARMEQAMRDEVATVRVETEFGPAVRIACDLAGSCAPCHVLLSPGFSSLDQFESYEARGKSFNSIVLGL